MALNRAPGPSATTEALFSGQFGFAASALSHETRGLNEALSLRIAFSSESAQKSVLYMSGRALSRLYNERDSALVL